MHALGDHDHEIVGAFRIVPWQAERYANTNAAHTLRVIRSWRFIPSRSFPQCRQLILIGKAMDVHSLELRA